MLLRALAGLALALPLIAESGDGYEEHGRAGWGTRVVTPSLETLARLDLAPGQGVEVVRVRPGGTADTLGIRPGDVITGLNGQPIATRRDLRAVVRAAAVGDEVVATLATPTGERRLAGEFQRRLPRPAGPPPWAMAGQSPPWATTGGPPPWAEDPAEAIARQQRQLLAEVADLAAARRDLAAARAQVPPSTAWSLTIDLAVGDAPLEDLP